MWDSFDKPYVIDLIFFTFIYEGLIIAYIHNLKFYNRFVHLICH